MSESNEIRYDEKGIKQEILRKKDPQVKKFISTKVALILSCVFVISVILFGASSYCNHNGSVNVLESQYYDGNDVGNAYDYPDLAMYENQNLHIHRELKEKRDSKSSSSSKKHKSTKPLDEPAIRFLLVLAGLVVLNMVAICVHHLFLKATRSEKSYRTIEQNISPF